MQTAIYVHTEPSDAIDSCDVQERMCRDFCERYGYDESVRVYRNEATSDDTYSGLQTLLDDVGQGDIQRLVLDTYSRLSCGRHTLEDVLHTLDLHNVAVVVVDDNCAYTDPVFSQESLLEDAVPSMLWAVLPTDGEESSNGLVMQGIFGVLFADFRNIVEWTLSYGGLGPIDYKCVAEREGFVRYVIHLPSFGDLAELTIVRLDTGIIVCSVMNPPIVVPQNVYRIRLLQTEVCNALCDQVHTALQRIATLKTLVNRVPEASPERVPEECSSEMQQTATPGEQKEQEEQGDQRHINMSQVTATMRKHFPNHREPTRELVRVVQQLKEVDETLSQKELHTKLSRMPGYSDVTEHRVRNAIRILVDEEGFIWKRADRIL